MIEFFFTPLKSNPKNFCFYNAFCKAKKHILDINPKDTILIEISYLSSQPFNISNQIKNITDGIIAGMNIKKYQIVVNKLHTNLQCDINGIIFKITRLPIGKDMQ